jgi:hypothetical protein
LGSSPAYILQETWLTEHRLSLINRFGGGSCEAINDFARRHWGSHTRRRRRCGIPLRDHERSSDQPERAEATARREGQGIQGIQGTPGIQGAPGSAKAWAVVGSAGNLIDNTSNVTGVSHVADSGIYCVTVNGVTDLQPAFVSLTEQGSGTGVFTVPSHPECAPGTVEVLGFDETMPSSTTAGTPMDTALADVGFVLIIP